MTKSIKIGSEFISMTNPLDKSWIRNIYWGPVLGRGIHGHIAASGSMIVGESVLAETWYARTLTNDVLVKNGSELVNNTSQLLSESIPIILREFQYPEKPLFWNVGSLDSFFSSQKKFLKISESF